MMVLFTVALIAIDVNLIETGNKDDIKFDNHVKKIFNDDFLKCQDEFLNIFRLCVNKLTQEDLDLNKVQENFYNFFWRFI